MRGRRVAVDGRRPELARWNGVPGQVVTVNGNGRCLVQFDGPNEGWHDIHPEFVQVATPKEG